MKIIVNGGQFFADGFAIRRAFSISDGESRLVSYISNAGCGAEVVAVKEGKVLIQGDGIEVINWGETAELRPSPVPFPSPSASAEITAGEECYSVFAAGTKIGVKGSAVAEWKTSVPLFSPKIRTIEGQRQLIAEITADCRVGRYLAMVSLKKGEARLLLEDCGESIVCKGNEVTIKRRFADNVGREVTTRYLWQGERFSSSREVVCAKDHTFIREEMGKLLLEAAMAKDGAGARALLSPEIADVDALFDYFGEILEVRTPLSSSSPTAVAAVARQEGTLVGVTYDFEFDMSGRIVNITRVGE